MSRRAFTLVELLVAMAVGIAVAGMASAAVAAGFRSWTRLAAGGALLETECGFLRFERDIASALPLPDAPFTGTATEISLPIERGGTLRMIVWSAKPDRLARSERDYLFDAEAAFDGRAADGSSLPLRTESYRIPAPARFSFLPAQDAPAVDTFTADSPTNLPYAVSLTAGDFSRACPARLSPSPDP